MTSGERVDVAAFRTILDTPGTETACINFLKEAPWIPYWTFCAASGHDRYVIFDFPLGNTFKADVLILNSYSGAWEALFIEFEPPSDKVFTKAGVPSARLATAQRQVDEWREYIDLNRDHVRSDMVRYAKTKDRLKYSDRGSDPSNYSGDRLADRNSFVHWRYKVVIGRSSKLSSKQRQLVGRYASGHNVEIVTYDRLLHLAERRYEDKHLNIENFVLDMPE